MLHGMKPDGVWRGVSKVVDVLGGNGRLQDAKKGR